MTTHWMGFGALLQAARTKSGKSQAALSRHLKVSSQHVSLIENGHRTPLTREKVLRAADFLGADPVPLLLARGAIELPLNSGHPERDVLAARLSSRWDALTRSQRAKISEALEEEI